MFLEFCVSNYLSIKEEQKISFVGSSLRENLPEPNEPMPLTDMGLQLVRSAVVYGANASGKTNVLRALAFYKRFVVGSFKDGQAGEAIDVESFRLNVRTADAPTLMEATFVQGDGIYRYGFEVDGRRVHKEWLYRRTRRKRAKEVEVFYREEGEVSVHARQRLMQELVDKHMVRDNALLLSTAAQFNEPMAADVLQWLGGTEILFGHDDETLWVQVLRRLDHAETRRRLVAFAQFADLGIADMEHIDNRIVSRHTRYDEQGREAGDVAFAFNRNESEGTIKYVALSYPIIHALDHGLRLVVDELDAKLHPLLVHQIVKLFHSAETNPKGAQLLFTTHDTNLLSAGLFRRDQVWFTRKDGFGATEVYSLAEYKVRGGAPYEKEYLRGKYGATPIVGEPSVVFGAKKS